MANIILDYFGWFIFCMSPDGTAFKVHSFISDLDLSKSVFAG